MKSNDLITVYSNPIQNNGNQGRARLIELICEYGMLEYWLVEYTDYIGRYFPVLIKK